MRLETLTFVLLNCALIFIINSNLELTKNMFTYQKNVISQTKLLINCASNAVIFTVFSDIIKHILETVYRSGSTMTS